MFKVLMKSVFLLLIIPLFTLALEPSNPIALCDRFEGAEMKKCEQKMQKEEIDWYAATVCNLQKDKNSFWTCWNEARNTQFIPAKLEKCGEDKQLNDAQRLTCLKDAKADRVPASTKKSIFQGL